MKSRAFSHKLNIFTEPVSIRAPGRAPLGEWFSNKKTAERATNAIYTLNRVIKNFNLKQQMPHT